MSDHRASGTGFSDPAGKNPEHFFLIFAKNFQEIFFSVKFSGSL